MVLVVGAQYITGRDKGKMGFWAGVGERDAALLPQQMLCGIQYSTPRNKEMVELRREGHKGLSGKKEKPGGRRMVINKDILVISQVVNGMERLRV